ncbi:response regulator, partial [Pseudomonas syringae pv. actinidifoliorum]|nr:response regulator [Pseudomonas syringae pv. actinidifoliorum]
MSALSQPSDKGVILIVDDTPDNLALLSDALDEAGYMVMVALEGISALMRIQRRRPDLILLDAMMPGMDGFETCRQIKQQPDASNIPVLFMTALTDSEHVVEGFEAGAIDYVTKPIQCNEMIARVASHLRTARTLQSARSTSQPPGINDAAAYTRLSSSFQLTEREVDVLRWVACGNSHKVSAALVH